MTRPVPRHFFLLALIGFVLVLTGCRGGSSPVRLSDLVPVTADAISLLLVGPPPEQQGLNATGDPPLMKKGVYETVLIAADTEAFARESRGAVSVRDILEVHKGVVKQVNDDLKRYGFRAESAPYPYAGGSPPKSLLCVLTPATEDAGSPTDRANGRGRKMVLVVLTISDPATGTPLAERRYYSGADARQRR